MFHEHMLLYVCFHINLLIYGQVFMQDFRKYPNLPDVRSDFSPNIFRTFAEY